MSKKPVNGNVKGKVFERAVCTWARANGFPDMERTAQHCGKSGDAADVRAPKSLPNLHIECKSVKSMNVGTDVLDKAMAQAWRDSPAGKTPVVIWRRSGAGMMLSWKQTTTAFLEDAVVYTVPLGERMMKYLNEQGVRKDQQ